MDTSLLMTAALGLLALGAVAFVAYPYLSGDIKAERRRAALQSGGAKRANERVVDAANRRKQVADSLKEIEQRNGKKKVSLETRIGQAGLAWSKQTYVVFSAVAALALGGGVFVVNGSPLFAAAAAGVGGLGLPKWYLSFRRKRRMNKFLHEFPTAVDIIVRGIKAGLPLADCLRVIATEASEPVRSEFRHIMEAQSVGLSIGEAVERIAERVPVPEANFFAIVISIQQKAGGNLSEALSNLSRVLRDRKKMKAKVRAVSSEANSSAMIIGAMPFAVGTLLYITSPRYIELLWTTDTGRMMMGIGAVWMGVGVAVMKKMIAFEI